MKELYGTGNKLTWKQDKPLMSSLVTNSHAQQRFIQKPHSNQTNSIVPQSVINQDKTDIELYYYWPKQLRTCVNLISHPISIMKMLENPKEEQNE